MTRRGYSLTELLVVMSMAGVVFTVGLGMVHRVMHEQKFASRDNAMHRVAERLSTTLRYDVHRATAAELVESDDQDRQRLILNLPDKRVVTYTVLSHELERVSTASNDAKHRDSFRFPDNYRLEFSGQANERVVFTAFALPQGYGSLNDDSQPSAIDTDVRRAVMLVEASVARDYRFLNDTDIGEL